MVQREEEGGGVEGTGKGEGREEGEGSVGQLHVVKRI